jgi:3',5'-cyclic AMP phosphodiesterase CpdA
MDRRPQGRKLLTIGVVGDTHVNEAEDFSASPYPANAQANPRARAVFQALRAMKPDFVVHLGDMINPVPELPTYQDAALKFREIAGVLDAPLYLVAGNHDVGDKPVNWMPAGQADDHSTALYAGHFGRHYFAFENDGILFVILNTSIINTGLPIEHEQREWLESFAESNRGRRWFLFIHYPPFITSEEEPGSYDNIDEPGRSWLLALIREYRPEAVLTGHVHNFWYNRINGTEIYTLPSTCFVRHDYSEMYRVEPGDQNGRNDAAKLGYGRLTVYESGHVLDVIRTNGIAIAANGDGEAPLCGEPINSRLVDFDRVGIDMRQPWAEIVEITPSGGIDEFERKKARNDYPLLAMWEMGIRRMRLPIQDLVDPSVRRRIELLREVGHIAHFHCYGELVGAQLAECIEHRALVDCLEVVVNWEGANTQLSWLKAIREKLGATVLLSRVNRKDAEKYKGGRYNHLISHGFTLAEADELRSFWTANEDASAISGVMISVPNSISPSEAVRRAARLGDELNKTICLYLRTSSASPAEDFFDDQQNTSRVIEALAAVAGAPNVQLILDTFADIDRGYFARSGLVDRRYNPKVGSRAVASLLGIVGAGQWRLVEEEHDSKNLILSLEDMEGGQLRLLTRDGSKFPYVEQRSIRNGTRIIELAGQIPRVV